MAVNRCICRNVPFARVAAAALEVGHDLRMLGKATGCGTGCGLCLPYIRRMLMTGNPNVPVMTPAEIAALMKHESTATTHVPLS